MKTFAIFLLLMAYINISLAQIDLQCGGRDLHSLYLHVQNDTYGFYRVDSVDSNPTNPIGLSPDNANVNGISINRNIFKGTNDMAMFGAEGVDGNYFFWNGTTWEDTHHAHGSSAINPGGTSSHIFSMDGSTGKVFRYDGTGNATLIVGGISGVFGKAVYDIATDQLGNFYVFLTDNGKIICFNPAGVPIDTFLATHAPTGIQPGFAILGNRMYIVDNSVSIYEGIKTGKTIDFTKVKSLGTLKVTDIAACPQAGLPLATFRNPEAPHFAVYPNPANNPAILKMHNTETIIVTDVLGRTVLKENINGLTEYTFSVLEWNKGVYFITAISRNGTRVVSKLEVQ